MRQLLMSTHSQEEQQYVLTLSVMQQKPHFITEDDDTPHDQSWLQVHSDQIGYYKPWKHSRTPLDPNKWNIIFDPIHLDFRSLLEETKQTCEDL